MAVSTYVWGLIPRAPPGPGVYAQLRVTILLSTGGGPLAYVQLSEGGFQVVYPLGIYVKIDLVFCICEVDTAPLAGCGVKSVIKNFLIMTT